MGEKERKGKGRRSKIVVNVLGALVRKEGREVEVWEEKKG